VASSLLALLDDIAVLTKVAAKKTAGVLGDDLALNAEQVAGVDSDRELLVVWAVAKGSMLNKAILVPAALLLSAFVPLAVIPLMIIGGAFLCFEGVEKLAHKLLHSKAEDDAHHADIVEVAIDPSVDLVAFEHDKIKGAIRTDFILSSRDHRDLARHGGEGGVRGPGRRASRDRDLDDGRGLWTGSRHR